MQTAAYFLHPPLHFKNITPQISFFHFQAWSLLNLLIFLYRHIKTHSSTLHISSSYVLKSLMTGYPGNHSLFVKNLFYNRNNINIIYNNNNNIITLFYNRNNINFTMAIISISVYLEWPAFRDMTSVSTAISGYVFSIIYFIIATQNYPYYVDAWWWSCRTIWRRKWP